MMILIAEFHLGTSQAIGRNIGLIGQDGLKEKLGDKEFVTGIVSLLLGQPLTALFALLSSSSYHGFLGLTPGYSFSLSALMSAKCVDDTSPKYGKCNCNDDHIGSTRLILIHGIVIHKVTARHWNRIISIAFGQASRFALATMRGR